MAFGHSTLYTAWGTALARSGHSPRGPGCWEAEVFGADAALRMGVELGWARGVVKGLPQARGCLPPAPLPAAPLEMNSLGSWAGVPRKE